ncbi:ATP-dependent Clp protease proteolytic subunit [Mesorhizobium amorphae]|uniref:ATP-dependent Clp protease proteolytic subunit n=1 Tax=Mesorhizobium amorphae TaxID=71433 RepID=UPI001786AF84|nr:ATP-dependent Clp protease proteolytic subunit [Mesorhizobium amorphae]
MYLKMCAENDPANLDPTPAEMAAARAAAELARANGSGPDHCHIEVRGEFNREKYYILKGQLDAAPFARKLTLHIDCNGGEAMAVFDAYVILRRHPAEEKTTVVIGRAESGGLVVAMAGDRRIVHRHSRILLHPSTAANPCDGTLTAARLEELAAMCRDVDRDIIRLIVARTGADPEVIAAEASNEIHSSLDWCRRVGLVHEIIEMEEAA